jgi:8-oxo-dGTP pyrophosphatase MutT (NUDIX family)
MPWAARARLHPAHRPRPHGGQVAFPGGVRENRGYRGHALREFEEELGVSRDFVTLVETCPEMLTLTTGYEVTPVIGRIPAGLPWRPDPREVADVFEESLAELRDPGNRHEIDVHYQEWPAPRRFPAIARSYTI